MRTKEERKIEVSEEKLSFGNITEFRQWKEKIEREMLSSYHIQITSSTYGTKRTYFLCHRSDYFQSESKGIRRIKSEGSKKVLFENKRGVNVSYCGTHTGRESNFGRCNPTANERATIAVLWLIFSYYF